MSTTIDDRGRVLIPKAMREELGLAPGQDVRFELEDDGTLRLRPVMSWPEFLDAMTGIINARTRKPDAEPIDPLELKRIWEPDP